MKLIPVGSELVALVDDQDYERVSGFTWHPFPGPNTCYARTTISGPNGSKKVLMHRLILGLEGRWPEVDHQDTNGLNNCRSNFRICTRSQNKANGAKYRNSTSRYKGVWWDKSKQRWIAAVRVSKQLHRLGAFADEIEAARAYDEAAVKHFGQFARPNFPAEISA